MPTIHRCYVLGTRGQPSLLYILLLLFNTYLLLTLKYREMGFLPQAIVNYLALLGWSDGTNDEFFTLDQLG